MAVDDDVNFAAAICDQTKRILPPSLHSQRAVLSITSDWSALIFDGILMSGVQAGHMPFLLF